MMNLLGPRNQILFLRYFLTNKMILLITIPTICESNSIITGLNNVNDTINMIIVYPEFRKNF